MPSPLVKRPSCSGGSTVEAWMPADRLDAFGDYAPEIEPFLGERALERYLEDRERRYAKWYEGIDSGNRAAYLSAIPEDAGTIRLPALFPERGEAPFSGSVWFYKEVFLKEDPGEEGFLYVGDLIDSDATYINGSRVGETAYRYPPRKYPFDAALLHKGFNRIAVRLVIERGRGGFVGSILPGNGDIPLKNRRLRRSWKSFFPRNCPRGFSGRPSCRCKASP